jgi:hypothetical protein
VLYSVDVAAGVLAWGDAVDAADKRVKSAVIGYANMVEVGYQYNVSTSYLDPSATRWKEHLSLAGSDDSTSCCLDLD